MKYKDIVEFVDQRFPGESNVSGLLAIYLGRTLLIDRVERSYTARWALHSEGINTYASDMRSYGWLGNRHVERLFWIDELMDELFDNN